MAITGEAALNWLKVCRAQYLILSLILVLLGTVVAAWEGFFDIWLFQLTLYGLVAMHISVNLLNEYSDFKSGIDFNTHQTEMSGGSGILISKKLKPKTVQIVGLTFLVMGLSIGGILVWMVGLKLLPIVFVGAIAVYFYTDFFNKHTLGEIFMALGLGLLPIVGIVFVQTGRYSLSSFIVGILAGLLGFTLLLLNEFPDVDADIKGGRRNLVIVLGKPSAGKLYVGCIILLVLLTMVGVTLHFIPIWGLISLGVVPALWISIRWAWSDTENTETMMPALRRNLLMNHLYLVVLGLGYLMDVII